VTEETWTLVMPEEAMNTVGVRAGHANEMLALGLRVLIIDDNESFARGLARWFRVEVPQSRVSTINDAGQALAAIREGQPDVVVLDWHLGRGPTGVQICQDARAQGCTVPIVMLTVADSLQDRMKALSAGVDEFVVKDSVAPQELCTRVQVAFWRFKERMASIPQALGPVVTAGKITVHVGARVVFVDGQVLHLPRHPRSILVRLARSKGEVVPYAELCRSADVRAGVGYKNLHNEVLRLRQYLGADAARHVRTLRGSGYHFD
jgi:DNA-binding response OmpR family regulator